MGEHLVKTDHSGIQLKKIKMQEKINSGTLAELALELSKPRAPVTPQAYLPALLLVVSAANTLQQRFDHGQTESRCTMHMIQQLLLGLL